MTTAAAFLGGAQERLLPASLPFSFFASAILFHLAMWVVLAIAAPAVPDFVGGPGLPLAALHLLTLGVLAATAMGAAFQLLPVATRQPLAAVWPARLAFWLFAPGVAILVYGMGTARPGVMAVGGTAVATGFVVFGLLIGDNLRRVRDLPLVAAHGWLALASLAALIALGLALIMDFKTGFLPDQAAAARAHMILAAYGFMGMLVAAFSQVLVPMFALSKAPGRAVGWTQFVFSGLALAIGAAGALASNTAMLAAAALLGLVAAGAHLWAMNTMMRRRMRKAMGLSFSLIRLAWVFLPLSLIVGLAALFGLAGAHGAQLFGFTLLFGWLLTFLLGILQRIIPFLAALQAAKAGRRMPMTADLTSTSTLRVHAFCHIGALALIAIGLAAGNGEILRAGAVLGAIGAAAFAYFGFVVMWRMAVAPDSKPRNAGGQHVGQ